MWMHCGKEQTAELLPSLANQGILNKARSAKPRFKSPHVERSLRKARNFAISNE